MADHGEHYRFRAQLAQRVTEDLVGPAGGEYEEIEEEPANAYVVGVLHPQADLGQGIKNAVQDFDETAGDEARDDVVDDAVPLANRVLPSALGLTFAVDLAKATRVLLTVSSGRYEAVNSKGEPVEPRRAERRTIETSQYRWRRRPWTPEAFAVDVSTPGDQPFPFPDVDAEVRVRCRPALDGIVSVTVSLINRAKVARDVLMDGSCLFQPQIVITVEGGAPALAERPRVAATDDETRRSDMFYRHAPLFAVGHACAARWTWDPPAPGKAGVGGTAHCAEVSTALVPLHELMLTDANPAVDVPRMQWLARAEKSEVLNALTSLVAGYRTWIDGDLTAQQRDLVGSRFAQVAQEQVDACRETLARMETGIQILGDETRPEIWQAFRLSNQVMAEQRARTVWIRDGGEGQPDLSAPRWRAFQIGFFLLCLRGIVEPEHEDREIADVLWFPTGGGKTEAYLGLVAFTTFLRRIRASRRGQPQTGGGVTVLMRYTLRLLTLQQFERAAALICAMEDVRRRETSSLGEEEMSIGMWVGKAATPNKLAQAQTSLAALADRKQLTKLNPVQLRTCPWCGHEMDHTDYQVISELNRLSITCPNPRCTFHDGLPVHVVDETIYAARPTLLIATADKFAQVAWRGEVANLFNRAGAPEGTPPPELVIQDELHLISGPLGSLAGLYEAAVDIAAERPKIVASTATIRRADEQGRALFDRRVRQFPPAGLDARDSWFAVERSREDKATRLYVGVMTSSTSQATLLIRTYAALLHHAKVLEGPDRVRDAYWTLVGYFNSLRLLSAAELQVNSDVDERLQQLAFRDQVDMRLVQNLSELTSRKDSSKIPEYLKELFEEYGSEREIDVLLATNMISVGVDVERLGLMAVMGQPQATAEYIQATSRVGRRDPGLVLVMLNSNRSRDRSHYENFAGYHSALYRQVESTSVTPWASRARDRALHAVLVGLLRLRHPEARPNAAAAQIADFLPQAQQVVDEIVERVRTSSNLSQDEHIKQLADAVRSELEDFLQDWVDRADSDPLVYEAGNKSWNGKRGPALLKAFGQDDDLVNAQDTMWSMRDVDVECSVYLER
ncbi:helicase-related protein [Kineosporia babensis]|uniref:Helicase C-terminal domain-containing protein n=1 Tax=Kineosporia babensis TaxID=499548 RepID=A0A9X1NMW5_9ACTN|nr:helicase C-terminal domain-containing protein [Kineosporia babensis]